MRIVHEISERFYALRRTKVANQGAATFWRYGLLRELYDLGQVADGFMLQRPSNHGDVVSQPAFDSAGLRGINPRTRSAPDWATRACTRRMPPSYALEALTPTRSSAA